MKWLNKMIRLVINEINKIKKSKIIFIQILFILVVYLIHKYSNKELETVSYNLIQFIGVVVCILFSGSICGEIENGNMKYYLTKPFIRFKIYFSKLIVIILYIFINTFSVISSVIIINHNIDVNYIIHFIKYSVPLVFIGVYTLYLSTKFKSSVFVASISIMTLCFSLILSQLLFGFDIRIVEYSFLPYLDLTIFNDNELISSLNRELGIHLSLNRGIIIDIIFVIIMFIFGSIKFNKKDIKN